MNDQNQPEVAVRRETIQKQFDPPIGKSTFYDLVERGKIVPIKGLRGFYRLNESLRRLGMPPAARVSEGTSRPGTLDDASLAEIALALAMPDEVMAPAALLDHELTGKEVLQVARLQRAYSQKLCEIHDSRERLGFAQGVRDAALLAGK